MARVYADAAQVEQLVGVSGATDITLRRASRVVDRILRGALYDVDDVQGLPTSAPVIEVMAEMTAEVVKWFRELGDETGASALGGSIGQVTLPSTSGQKGERADGLVAPLAVDLARSCGLFRWRVES